MGSQPARVLSGRPANVVSKAPAPDLYRPSVAPHVKLSEQAVVVEFETEPLPGATSCLSSAEWRWPTSRADVQRWFTSMSATPGNANRVLPVLSVMMRRAELWELRPQESNPCRNMPRYKTIPRERFLSAEELERLGSVLGHAEDQQAVAAIRLLLFTGARSSEITELRWDWIKAPAPHCPTPRPAPRWSNSRPRHGPFSRPCRAPARSSSPAAGATAR